MSSGLLALLAFSPILLAAILLIGLRWPAKRAMPLVYLLTAGIALTVWDMSVNRVLASTLQGLVITAGVLWIIFGAFCWFAKCFLTACNKCNYLVVTNRKGWSAFSSIDYA